MTREELLKQLSIYNCFTVYNKHSDYHKQCIGFYEYENHELYLVLSTGDGHYTHKASDFSINPPLTPYYELRKCVESIIIDDSSCYIHIEKKRKELLELLEKHKDKLS
jgi:hypothetical protein